MSAESVQNLAANLLPANLIANQTIAQQTTEVQSTISQSVQQVVSSAQFSGLWKSANQSTQQQLIQELNSNSSTIMLDLHPTVLGVFNLLNSTKLAAINSQTNIPNDLGKLNLTGSAVPRIHKVYTLFKEGTWALILVTIFCIGICIWASVHHIKTIRRILMGTGILSLLLALILKIPGLILNSNHRTGLEQQAILAVLNTLFSKLFIASLVIGIICILAAIGSKLFSVFTAKKKPTPRVTPTDTNETKNETPPATA